VLDEHTHLDYAEIDKDALSEGFRTVYRTSN